MFSLPHIYFLKCVFQVISLIMEETQFKAVIFKRDHKESACILIHYHLSEKKKNNTLIRPASSEAV